MTKNYAVSRFNIPRASSNLFYLITLKRAVDSKDLQFYRYNIIFIAQSDHREANLKRK